MEEDEDIQSHPSPDSGSPASPPHPHGRITVTVATAPPQNTLTLALPIQQPRTGGNGGGGGGGGGREDCWSEGATSVLIDAWGERYLELSRGNLKQNHWKEVADIVRSQEDYTKTPKTDIQCKNRIDTVKKKYKLEKAKIASGSGPTKWPFFNKLDQLIGPTATKVTAAAAGTSSVTPALPSGGHRSVPMGIPVGVRPVQFQKQQQPQLQQKLKLKQKQLLRRQPPVDSDSSHSEAEPERKPSPDSTDSFPPETCERKRPRIIQQRELNLNPSGARKVAQQGKEVGGRDKNWASFVRELTQAILKFGEAYEQAENSKLQQLVEMEKQRMKFAKDLELQRMKFFMNTELEISQLKHRRVGNNNHHFNTNTNINNNSDSNN